MKFVMIGSGAVGSYFGAKLLQANHQVVFVARGAHLHALTERGLILRHDADEALLRPTAVSDDLTTVGAADYVLICVKSWQVAEIARSLPALPASRYLTTQNGVEAGASVARHVGAEATLSGLVRGFFQMDAPGIVRHVGVKPAIIFGQVSGGRTPPAEALLAALTAADIYAELSENVEVPLWEKFLMVTALSGVGAVTRSPIGEIRSYAPTFQMLQAVMTEIAQVARARGISLPGDVVERTLKFVATFPDEATTSMQRDMMSGQPSELEAQTGAVVRLGHEAGVATPLNQFIYDSLILQETRARAQQ
jgi:2-dehydropantoate 2-reductase